MLNVNNQIDDTVKVLYQNASHVKGGCHIQLNEIFNDPTATAVISVYIDERPADAILKDLSAWAEKEGLDFVINKIDELAQITQNK